MEVRQLKFGKSASKILMFTRSSHQNKYHHNARVSLVTISHFEAKVITSFGAYIDVCYKVENYEVTHLSSMSSRG